MYVFFRSIVFFTNGFTYSFSLCFSVVKSDIVSIIHYRYPLQYYLTHHTQLTCSCTWSESIRYSLIISVCSDFLIALKPIYNVLLLLCGNNGILFQQLMNYVQLNQFIDGICTYNTKVFDWVIYIKLLTFSPCDEINYLSVPLKTHTYCPLDSY